MLAILNAAQDYNVLWGRVFVMRFATFLAIVVTTLMKFAQVILIIKRDTLSIH